MSSKHTLILVALACAALTASLAAQTQIASNSTPSGPGTASTPATPQPQPPITAADVQALRDALTAQQAEIEALRQQLQRQNDALHLGSTNAPTDVSSGPHAPAPAADSNGIEATTVLGDSAAGQGEEPKPANPMEGPLTIRFKGIDITPGGFAEAAFIRRSRALGADLTTPFNSLTMPGASQSQMSEFYGSARQSRPTIYVFSKHDNFEMSSYASADFLSSGTSSTATQTNSYTLRLRQFWGQVKFNNGWSLLGGQAWSLVTENKESIAPSDDTGRTNDSRPATIDPGYNVGFTFARQYGLRVTKAFDNKLAFAIAIENPQGTVTTHNNGDNFLLGSAGAGSSYNSAITNCSSAFAPNSTTSIITTCTPAGTYTFNPSPDIIAKVAADPGFGHYEIFGLFDRFRDRVFPCGEVALPVGSTTGPCPNGIGTGPSALGAYNVSRNGGAVGANARWNFDNKHIVFGVHAFGGNGVGRYGAAQLADMSIKAWGGPDLIRGYQGLGTLEWHGPKLDIYLYTGGEYASRTSDYDPISGDYVGYGSPFFRNDGCYSEVSPNNNNGFLPASLSHCTADTRVIIEGTAGFWYRFYSGPRGRFQFGSQYSYITRNTWSGLNGIDPHGIEGEVFTSFRYYLP
jgi:hypothetical protein